MQTQLQRHGKSSSCADTDLSQQITEDREEISMRKKTVCFIMAACMILTLIPSVSSAAATAEAAGHSGTDRSYSRTKRVSSAVSGTERLRAGSMLQKKAESFRPHREETAVYEKLSAARATAYAVQIKSSGKKYRSLQAAVNAAVSGDTITLLRDLDDISVSINRGSSFRLTIDLAGHQICSYSTEETVLVKSGRIRLRNGYIVNMYTVPEADAASGARAAAVTVTGARADLDDIDLCTGDDYAAGICAASGSTVDMDRCGYYGFYDIETEPEDDMACYVAADAKLVMNACYLETNYGDGVVSEGEAYINDSTIITNYDDTALIPEPSYSALNAVNGGKVNVNDGFYFGVPALYVEGSGSSATVLKGEFQAPKLKTACPAIGGCDTPEDDAEYVEITPGYKVNLMPGYIVSPADWKDRAAGSIFVYRDFAAPEKTAAKLSAYDAVTVSWNKVEDAAGYKVYYKKASDKSYSLLKQTSGTSAKKTKLTPGVKYRFLVYSCDSLNSELSKGSKASAVDIYTLKKLGRPSVVKKSATAVTVSWKNIPGESGYQISKSTSPTGTKIVSTWKTTTGKARDIKAEAGKKYYYKVRAYSEVDGTRIYAPWSDTRAYTMK